MSEVPAPALQESLPPQQKSQRWLFLGGFAALVLVLAFFWMRSAQGATSPNNGADQAPCCVP